MDAETLARIDAGDARAQQQALSTFLNATREERAPILDGVARLAASGSARGLELLLQLVDDHGLDRPTLRKLLINDAEVEDAHQDVLIAIARSISNFRSESAFTTWLHTVARNTAITHLRRRRETDRMHTDMDISDAHRLSSMIATRSMLRDAVSELPSVYREALVLRDVEQCSYAEVAERLGLELNTVKSRISRGRALVSQSEHFTLDGDDG